MGSAIARELSRYDISVVVFEKGSDVASGASKANSGVIHSGINSPPSSLKARFCVEGNLMFSQLSRELGVPIKWTGKCVIAKTEHEVQELERLRECGMKNGVPGLEILDGNEVKKREHHVVCCAALWVPTAGITLPYEFTIALAENAAENGVRFLLDTPVTGLKKKSDGYAVETGKGAFHSDVVINAAGVHCREIVAMLEEPDFQVYPCRGEYLVLDKEYRSLVNAMIYPVPVKELGVLGVHITPTIEGNILLGPSAEFISDPEDTSTTGPMMETLLSEAREIIPEIPKKGVIAAYAGIRCKLAPPESGGWADYRVEERDGVIHLLGIESPGLTAAPAMAQEVVRMISRFLELKEKPDFNPKRSTLPRFSELSREEQSRMIEGDGRWGRVVCRCEHVTEAEVIDALANPLGARTLAAVKYRCRAGMGRCQGGFCTQHVVRIMEEHFGMDIRDITLKSQDSYLFSRRTRGESDD